MEAEDLNDAAPPTGRTGRVLVVGAGLSGLVALKELLAAGLDAVCFEAGRDIGGVFADGGSYEPLLLTVSNYFMAYSDFMPLDEELRFWTSVEYKAYLDRYAGRSGLPARIRFETPVTGIRRLSAGWEVEYGGPDGETVTEHFTHVAVCSGQFQTPRIPRIPGLESFPGIQLHSSDYHGPTDLEALRGKRVLCLGLGE